MTRSSARTIELPDDDLGVHVVVKAYASMVSRLSTVLVLSLDGELRDAIKAIANVPDGKPLVLAYPKSDVWFEADQGIEIVVRRGLPQGLDAVDLDALVATHPVLSKATEQSIFRTGCAAAATSIVEPIFAPESLMSRVQFETLERWSPLLEQMAYASASQFSKLVEKMRPGLRTRLMLGESGDAAQLQFYWWCIHRIAHLLLLAASPQAQPWLSKMANHFPWSGWTPTFWLIRERTTWLAAAAARSAMAFGDRSVEVYFRALSGARHPMIAFDALFGLTAIALSDASALPAILKGVQDSQVGHLERTHSRHVEAAYGNAIDLLTRGASQPKKGRAVFPRLDWRSGGANGLATRAGRFSDPTALSEHGFYIGFSMLPFVASGSIAEHYPKSLSASQASEISDEKLTTIFNRAWLTDQPEASRLLH